jgi:hypothetical protein
MTCFRGFLLALCAACTGYAVAGTGQPTVTGQPSALGPESYQVYSASLPFGYHTAGMTVAIRSRTVAVPNLEYAAPSVKREFDTMKADPELAQAIRQMMTQRPDQDLKASFHMTDPYELLDSDALDGELRLHDTPLGRKAGWRAFNEAHQAVDGLTEISAIGFNPAHTVAVFYAIHRSGTGCNDEGFEVLHKKNGRWRRVTEKGFSFAECN